MTKGIEESGSIDAKKQNSFQILLKPSGFDIKIILSFLNEDTGDWLSKKSTDFVWNYIRKIQKF